MSRRIMNKKRMKFAKEYGEDIKNDRKSLGWTQVELAKRAGITQGYLSKIENGIMLPDAYDDRTICTELYNGWFDQEED